MGFNIGDKVEWSSSAGGSTTTKIGEIVVVVPAKDRMRISGRISKFNEKIPCKSAFGGGMPRDHESYLVLVPHKGNGMPTLYWPRVSALKTFG